MARRLPGSPSTVSPPHPEPMTTRCRGPGPSSVVSMALMPAPVGYLNVGDTGEVALQGADRPVADPFRIFSRSGSDSSSS